MVKLNPKLLKKLASGELLVPYIDIYQNEGKFPPVWNIQIDNNKRVPDLAFHPSSDCFATPSQLYARLNGQEPKKIPFSLRRTFDCGHFWHGYYQEMVLDMGYTTKEDIERSVSFSHKDGWEAKGTADLVIDLPRKGIWLVDMKTMNDKEYDEGPYEITKKKWAAQVNMYMEWLGIRKCFILAIRKGGTPAKGGLPSHGLREIPIEYDKGLIEAIYAKWSYVWDCYNKQEEPKDDGWI